MRYRVARFAILFAILLSMALPSAALAKSQRSVTGTIQYTMTLLDGTVAPCWASYSIHMKADGSVWGSYRWWAWHSPGLIPSLSAQVVSASFSEREAVFVARITRIVDWPDLGCEINYAKVWVRDGGSPGAGHDRVGFFPGDCGPAFTYDPGLGPGFRLEFAVEGGNATIR